MKRRKHKDKGKNPTVIFCSRCFVVDVTKDDGELECICSACWVILNRTQKQLGTQRRGHKGGSK